MFDATHHFGRALGVLGGGALIAACWLGIGPGLFALGGAAVALYWSLNFFNALEARDRRDAAKRKPQRRRAR